MPTSHKQKTREKSKNLVGKDGEIDEEIDASTRSEKVGAQSSPD